MSIWNKKNEGGFSDVIRCDQSEYLIWKWRPEGMATNTTKKENAIRYGSSLRVKEGEVAVFVYPQSKGELEYIEGPYDKTILTGNFPILTSIVGTAFGGSSPFQAEIYFINLSGIIKSRFGVRFFDVADPRFLDYTVPVAVRGNINFKISDYKAFIKMYQLREFDIEDFREIINPAVNKYVKSVVTNIPQEKNIPVIQLERKIEEINEIVEGQIINRFTEFGVTVNSLDIDAIDIDKTSNGYRQLMSVTQDLVTQKTQAFTDIEIKQQRDMQQAQMENIRIQQEGMRLQNETANLTAFQLEKQAEVGIAGANALGQLGASGAGNFNLGSGGAGINPAGLMAGMAMGSAIGQNMAGMVGGMMGGLNQQIPPAAQAQVPPVPGNESFHVAVNGAATGPYPVSVLSTMVANGQFTAESLVWKKGMANWEKAADVPSLAGLFAAGIPPVPPQL